MRIWIGQEQEGIEVGIETIFVESKTITTDLFSIIFNAIDKYNVKRVYLGAGRVDCVYVDNAYMFVEECKKRNVQIVQETSVECFKYINTAIADYGEIVLTLRDNNVIYIPKNISFKIDNYIQAILYQNTLTSIRELNDVKDNMYACDTIIFETNR